MKDELVSFETAKLAKDKGFNEQCKYLFIKDSSQPLYECDTLVTNSSGNVYPAVPTQSLLQRWLREKHNISVHMYSIHGGKTKWGYDLYNLGEGTSEDTDYIMYSYLNTVNKDNIKTAFFDTYEIALEEGLKKSLSFIKI